LVERPGADQPKWLAVEILGKCRGVQTLGVRRFVESDDRDFFARPYRIAGEVLND